LVAKATNLPASQVWRIRAKIQKCAKKFAAQRSGASMRRLVESSGFCFFSSWEVFAFAVVFVLVGRIHLGRNFPFSNKVSV
jgi:hypothetical protein